MIDHLNEVLIEFEKSGDHFPGPRKPSRSALYRWATSGIRGHKLSTLVVGYRRYTSETAIHQFIIAQNQAPAAESHAPAIPDASIEREAVPCK